MKLLFFISFLAFFFISACKSSADDYEKVNANGDVYKGAISFKNAKALVNNYQGRGFKPTDRVGFNDTRCIWFSLNQLESFLQQIKKEKGDGVRFYLAAYGLDSVQGNSVKNSYLDHTTLVMVSTKDSIRTAADTIHVDYFDDKGGVIITASPENQGELCPPPANCVDEGALLLKQ